MYIFFFYTRVFIYIDRYIYIYIHTRVYIYIYLTSSCRRQLKDVERYLAAATTKSSRTGTA